MQCSVHTLQLAVKDSFKKKHHIATLISKYKQVATSARTPKIDAILKKRSGLGAILDQETCWGRTYMMIEHLLDLNVYLEELANKDASLTKYEWDQLMELEALLQFPLSVTKTFQSENLTPNKFSLK